VDTLTSANAAAIILGAIVDEDPNNEILPAHLTFLLHFFDELRRRAPVEE